MSESGGLLDVFNSLRDFRNEELCEPDINGTNITHISETAQGNISECVHHLDLHKFYIAMPAISMVVVFILSFLITRRLWKLNLFNSRPGILYPINTLDMCHTQFLYCLTFGVVAHLLHNIIFGTFRNPFHLENQPRYLEVLIKLAAVAVYGVALYPLFACISLGSFISFSFGSVYIWVYSYVNIAGLFYIDGCVISTRQYVLITINHLPFIFCMLALSFSMPVYAVLQFRRGCYFKSIFHDEACHISYSKKIMSHRVKERKSFKKRVHHQLSKVQATHQGLSAGCFTYPPALLGCLCVAFVVVYMSAVIVFVQVQSFLQPICTLNAVHRCATGSDERAMKQVFFEVLYGETNSTHLMQTKISALNILRVLEYITYVFDICLQLALVLAIILNMVQIPFILISFKRHMLSLYRGKYSNLVPMKDCGRPAALLVYFTKYTGYQIAYLSWAIMIQAYVMCSVFLLVAFFVFIPVWNDFGNAVLDVLKVLVPALLLSFMLNYMQILFSKYFFLQDEKCLGVDNRRMFFVWSYFMFFYNIYLGFFSCIIRMVTNASLCLLFLGRLDFSLMARSFESRDAGFKAYLGFLHVHHAHSNPHLLTFVHILTEGQQSPGKSRHSMRSRSLWLLAYTLHNNRGLLVHRKRYLEEVRVKLARLNTVRALLIAEKSEKNNVKIPLINV